MLNFPVHLNRSASAHSRIQEISFTPSIYPSLKQLINEEKYKKIADISASLPDTTVLEASVYIFIMTKLGCCILVVVQGYISLVSIVSINVTLLCYIVTNEGCRYTNK